MSGGGRVIRVSDGVDPKVKELAPNELKAFIEISKKILSAASTLILA